MSISKTDIDQLTIEVSSQLEFVCGVWDQVGDQIRESSLEAKAMVKSYPVPSKIPGHKIVYPNEPVVDDFVAFVADIRDSTKHLTESDGVFNTRRRRLFRVHMEMAAISAAASYFVRKRGGAVTEFLGDGVLAMFAVGDDVPGKCVSAAYNTGLKLLESLNDVVNPHLDNYKIPPISVGVGIALSDAIVTVIGDGEVFVPKAIGECVFRATKLSDGTNEVTIDDVCKKAFPTSKGGGLSFSKVSRHKEIGYVDCSKKIVICKRFKTRERVSR